MASDRHFKMKQSTKIMLALVPGKKEDKHFLKKAMINAQQAEEAARRASLKSKEKTKDAD